MNNIDLTLDCIIILNGDVAEYDISLLSCFNGIKIAADGSANTLIANNVIPDYIIGDLDSFNAECLPVESKIINILDQSQYDFEKCLEFAVSNNWHRILLIGMNGGALDHTLNNWSIFIKYASNLQLFSYACGQIGTLITSDITFDSEVDDIISIIPFPSATLTTDGLKWKLTNTKLEFGKSEGARNKTTSEKVTIKLHSGKYILFITINNSKIRKYL